MTNYNNLKRKAADYQRVLTNTQEYRKAWKEELSALIKNELQTLLDATELQGTVEERSEIANLSAITLSLGNVQSGMSQEVAQGVNRELIKHNGSLTYQQLFNGKVIVIIQYPFIENYGKPQPPKTIAIYRPEELRPPFFQRHVEELLTEITKWEDYDDDEPNQKIGFKLNFEQPELSSNGGGVTASGKE
jgi:hypothetical protein